MRDFTKFSDSELVDMITTIDHNTKSAAFSEIYKRYNNRIYLYCRKVFGDGTYADDIFQDTFLNFLKSVESGTKVENVIGFLLKTARNLSLNQKRSNSKVFTELEDFHYVYNDRQFENKELNQMIELAIEVLPDNYKEAFILQVYEDFSYQEIADFLELPLPTIRNRIVRAKAKLRETLTPYLEHER